MSNSITNYWAGHTVESAKKEEKRLKNYAPGSAPRRADNLDSVPSYAEQREKNK